MLISLFGVFDSNQNFNQNISRWNVENVENMTGMFYNATSFNQPIGKWKITKLNNIDSMFHSAESFNQDLSSWDISNCHGGTIFDNCPIEPQYKPIDKKKR